MQSLFRPLPNISYFPRRFLTANKTLPKFSYIPRRFLATNREEMHKEYKINEEAYWKIRNELPKGKTVGFVDGKIVAVGDNYNHVYDQTMFEVIYNNGGEVPQFNSCFVTIVGRENEEPQVIVVEVPQIAFHSSQVTHLSWSEVAKPVSEEWLPSKETNWTLRFIGAYSRPYVTLPVTIKKSSVITSPVTFLIDTGSPTNFLKTSVFIAHSGLPVGEQGNTNLWINEQSFRFSCSSPQSVHGNINLLGTDFLQKNPKLLHMLADAYSKGQHLKNLSTSLWEEGRNIPPQSGDWK